MFWLILSLEITAAFEKCGGNHVALTYEMNSRGRPDDYYIKSVKIHLMAVESGLYRDTFQI